MASTTTSIAQSPTQGYTAAPQTSDSGHSLYQQTIQSSHPEILVKGRFEKHTPAQKKSLADEFINAAGRDGLRALSATPEGQHALAFVYEQAGDEGRGQMRQVHEEQGNTAVDYSHKGEAVCTPESHGTEGGTPEEQYLNKLMRHYSEHASGKMPLPPAESLQLRSEIERVSQIINPGQQNLWGDYSAEEKHYLSEQAQKSRREANNLGIWFGGPVFSALPALARTLNAPESVVEGMGQINAEIAGAKSLGRQGRGIEPVHTPIYRPPVMTHVMESSVSKQVRVDSRLVSEGGVSHPSQGPDSNVQGTIVLDSKSAKISRSTDSMPERELVSGSTARMRVGTNAPDKIGFNPAPKSGLNISDNIRISGNGDIKTIELELRGQRIGIDGKVEPHKFTQHSFQGSFNSKTGGLSIDWYETTNTGNKVGREIISSVIEKVGANNVTSISAKLGNTNRTVFDGFIQRGFDKLKAVQSTPLGKSLSDLGFTRFNVERAPGEIEAFWK